MAKAEANDDRDTAVMAYAVQRACSELEESRREFTAANATIHNLELKVEQLVAENAALKTYRPQPHGAAMMEALDAFFEREDVPEQGMMASFEILCCKRPPTPAIDAAIANLRAQGVEMAIEHIEQTICPNHETILREFAAQLRQGDEHE